MMRFENRILVYFVRKCRKIRKIKIRKRVEKMYIIRKAMEYFKPKINKAYMNEALKKLTEKEKKIFLEMSDYDKFHSLEVYKKIKKTELKNNEKYLKLALLHDCGKENVSIITRVLHKLGFKTQLRNHAQRSFEKLEKVDEEVAVLAKNHHNRGYSQEMDIFQKCDDES